MQNVPILRRLLNGSGSRRGQSFVEFALVLPMLLVILLGIADFGRIFADGITLEAAARNGAEAAAQEYLQLKRNLQPGAGLDYARLHQVALKSVCAEAKTLSNYASGGGTCTMPFTEVCVWTNNPNPPGLDPGCLADAPSPPAECTQLAGFGNGLMSAGAGGLPYVEVRLCYQFRTIFSLSGITLPFNFSAPLGDAWLQRDRSFVVADY